MNVCITGATGFVGAHLAFLAAERGHELRVTYRNEARLARLRDIDFKPVRADILDRSAMRRAVRGCDVLFHAAGMVGSNPADAVWQANAVSPRVAVEAAAAEDVRRVVVTSSVAGIGPVTGDGVGSEDDPYTGGGMGMTYPDSKHEGEAEAMRTGARLGVEVVVVNPSYVLGVPVDRTQPGETSTRVVGNYLRGRLPAVVDGASDFCDVRDVAEGHLAAAEKGRPGERYVLGGHRATWPELIGVIADVSGVHRPVAVIPPGAARLARRVDALGLSGPVPLEGIVLMAQNWAYSSAKAKRELGYHPRALRTTVRETVEWYRELYDTGILGRGAPSVMSLGSAGLHWAERSGALRVVRAAERSSGRRLLLRS